MKILSLDTSAATCSAAIIDENSVIANFDINIGITHSETLLPIIDTLSTFSKIDIKDIDVLSCSTGPGSFTGLRIGISTIKGMAISLNKKVVAVPTLLGLAYNVPYFDGIICTILDAKNNNVYAANFKKNETMEMQGEYFSDSLDTFLNILKNYNEKFLFVGDGALVYKEILLNHFGERANFMPMHLNFPMATSIAKAALDMVLRNEYTSYDLLTPLYLKKSQAERMLDENAKNNN